MRLKKTPALLIGCGALLVLMTGIWLATAGPVQAQCGSQASSCKNCHETQAQDPVNNDGTAWHTQHAFGDFCYLCHGGNNQATDKAAAHAGMVAPLSDINAACKSCHATDLLAKAQVYATTLGVEVGTAGTAASPEPPASSATATAAPADPNAAALPANSADLVNYVQNYNQSVLGQKPTNWGNVILLIIVLLLLVGGGGFILLNEKLIRVRFKLRFGDTRVAPANASPEYPAEVVEMLPALSRLSASSRRSLQNILQKPEKSNKVLKLIHEILADDVDDQDVEPIEEATDEGDS